MIDKKNETLEIPNLVRTERETDRITFPDRWIGALEREREREFLLGWYERAMTGIETREREMEREREMISVHFFIGKIT